MTGSFEILSVDVEKKRIGVALVADASARSQAAAGAEIAPGARLHGKVERHEKFGVFVFLAPGRTGLIPTKETGVLREADIARTFPVGSEVEVQVLEVDPSGRRIRLSRKAVLDAKEKDEVREYTERKSDTPCRELRVARREARGAMRPKEALVADHLHQHPLRPLVRRTRRRRSAPTVRSRASLRHGDDDLAPHDLPLVVGVAVVLAGPVVPVALRVVRGERLEPLL